MKNKLFLLFLLLILNIFFINSQLIVTDVTIVNQSFQYNHNLVCQRYKFLYVVNDLTINNAYELSLVGNDPVLSSYLSISRLSMNSSASLYTVDIAGIPVGVYSHSFLASNNVEFVEFKINYECSLIPEIQIKNISTRGMELDVFGKVSAIFKMENAKVGFSTQVSCRQCLYFNLGNNYGVIQMYNPSLFVDGEIFAEINFNSNASNRLFFKPNSYYKSNVYDEITDINIYPDIQNMFTMSNNLLPVFTFYSNNTINYRPLYVKGENYLNNILYKPISNLGKKIKYIGYFDYSGISSTNLTIYSQNSDNYQVFLNKILNINGLPFSPLPSTIDMLETSNYFTIDFNFSGDYYFTPYKVEFFGKSQIEFPFGHTGSVNSFRFKGSFFKEPIVLFPQNFYFSNFNSSSTLTVTPNGIITDFSTPVFQSIDFIKLVEHYYILRIKVSYSKPVYKISVDSKYYYLEYLSDNPNNNLLTPTFDLIINGFNPINFLKVDESVSIINLYDYYDINNLLYFNTPVYNDKDFDYFALSYAKILYKNINCTNQNAGNILYFNYSNINIETPISLLLYSPNEYFEKYDGEFPTKDLWPARWNNTIQMFQVEFFIKSNSHAGKIPYALFFDNKNYVPSYVLPDSAQFNIISNNEDLYGPIFDNIIKFKNYTTNTFGWSFNIVDEVNGFKNGIIIVRGGLDGSIYNFTINAADKNEGGLSYKIEIPFGESCATQDYIITYVKLYDKLNYNSTFEIANYKNSFADSLSNPFINYLNDSYINRYTLVCNTSLYDPTPPELVSFEMIDAPNITNKLDVGNINYLKFAVMVKDLETGIKIIQVYNPILYLMAPSLRSIQCYPNAISNNETFAMFGYSCEVPIGFGYPYGIIFQLGSFVNNGGFFSSFSSSDLKAQGFRDMISSSEMTMSLNYPFVMGSNKITVDGGDLWVYGRGFVDVINVTLKFVNSNQINLPIYSNYKSALHFKDLPSGLIPFTLIFQTIGGVYPTSYLITPMERVSIVPVSDSSEFSSSSSGSNSSNSSSDFTPVDPDICKGKPKCGGLSNGYCSKTGCICYSPWMGDDCLSKVIIVPQPKPNNTDPTTGIDIPSDSSGSDDINNIIYKSFISMVSLREIDINGKVINEELFDKWIYTKLNNNSNQYQTNISTSTIVAKLEWFEKESSIVFANQTIKMNPSSIKYTIDIYEYPFKSRLNSLELIMSASLEASKTNDICSSQQFGNTSDSDNYMKIQVDNHSLYGVFIKRGVFDNNRQIRSVSNRLLKSSIGNNEHSSNTLIAINMGYFENHATIDPNFNIIIDYSSASKDSENSICSSNNNKLSKSKIAGIVIGGVAFLCIFIVCTTYYFIKRKNQKKFFDSVQNKLKELK